MSAQLYLFLRPSEEAVIKLASQGLMGNELCQAAPRAEVRSWTALGIGYMWLWCVAAHCYWPGVARHSIRTSRGRCEKTGFVGFNGNELFQAAPRAEVRSWTALGIGYMWLWCVAAHCYWPGVARHSIRTSRGSCEKTGFAGFNGKRVISGCTPCRGA